MADAEAQGPIDASPVVDVHGAWAVHGAGPDAATAVVAPGTLPRAWVDRWRRQPDRPVLLGPDGRWYDGADLERGSTRAAARLAALGVHPGDRVVVSATASTALVLTHIGALRLGAVVVPMNTAYQHGEIAHIVGDAQPTAVVLDDAERVSSVRAIDPALAVVSPFELAADEPVDAEPELDASQPGDDALICYTSGTTGRPKGAVLTHRNLVASVEALRQAWRWTPDDRLLLSLPLFHVHGLGIGLHGALLAGGSVVLLERFDADAVISAIVDHGCTQFFGVPTMYSRLVASPRAEELAGLRLCVSGSAPLPAALFERMAKLTGHHVLERYGMSETLMLVSNPHDGERRPGSVGLALPGVELRLADGTTGEVSVRGPNVFRGYWGNDAATAAAFDGDWFRTGDVGALDPDGYLRLVGRAKDLIITGGYNVYPREVEEALADHPGVVELAVAGVPSDEWGETVAAYLVAGPDGVDLESLRALAAERLAAYKRPRAFHLVDALPRNALGKVVRGELRPPG